jgi:hypothetical protein
MELHAAIVSMIVLYAWLLSHTAAFIHPHWNAVDFTWMFHDDFCASKKTSYW